MSYEKLLTETCDIYHLKTKENSENASYGVPIEDRQEEYYYSDTPDLKDVKCYLVERNQTIVQLEPNAQIIQSYNAHFSIDTDIRRNSKVVWEGIKLKAQQPRKIRNHHIEVVLIRDDSL